MGHHTLFFALTSDLRIIGASEVQNVFSFHTEKVNHILYFEVYFVICLKSVFKSADRFKDEIEFTFKKINTLDFALFGFSWSWPSCLSMQNI